MNEWFPSKRSPKSVDRFEQVRPKFEDKRTASPPKKMRNFCYLVATNSDGEILHVKRIYGEPYERIYVPTGDGVVYFTMERSEALEDAKMQDYLMRKFRGLRFKQLDIITEAEWKVMSEQEKEEVWYNSNRAAGHAKLGGR